MSNKSNGTSFEREFAQMMYEHGFWAHLIQDNRNGQPFDLIAAKDGIALVFDCKDCETDIFNLSRIEENQKAAMELWSECGNHEGLFVIRFRSGNIYILPYTLTQYLEHSKKKSFRENEAGKYAFQFKEWIKTYESDNQ